MSQYTVVEVIWNLHCLFVETEKMTTQCYFLEFIIACYVIYWMECWSLKYDVDM